MLGPIPRQVLMLALVACVISPGVADDKPATESNAQRTAVVIPLHGEITPFLGAFIERKLEQAQDLGAEVVIIDIESPGGSAFVSFELARALRKLDWAETVAYVEKDAISGAAIAALGCDKIIMAPGAMLGDAGVIEQETFMSFYRYVPEKALSKIVADMREIAEAGDRPQALAEAMMNKDVQVFEATNKEDGRTWYFSKDEWESMKDADQWDRGKPVNEARANTYLTVTGKRALELQLAEGVANSRAELFEQINVKEDPQILAQSKIDTVVWILNSPFITGLLFVIGLLALVVEFSAPGVGLGGLVSTLCFSLFFWSRFLGGTAGWLEVVLFVVGLVFIAMEVFVIPGFGVSGISGILLVLGSLVMASRHVVLPESQSDLLQLNQTLATVGISIVGFLILTAFAGKRLLEMPGVGRFMLAPPEARLAATGTAIGDTPAGPAPWELVKVGDEGKTNSPLRPAGKVNFGNNIVDVVSEGDFIENGTPVKVIQIQGTKVVVRSAGQSV